jgi:hypothetical protein
MNFSLFWQNSRASQNRNGKGRKRKWETGEERKKEMFSWRGGYIPRNPVLDLESRACNGLVWQAGVHRGLTIQFSLPFLAGVHFEYQGLMESSLCSQAPVQPGVQTHPTLLLGCLCIMHRFPWIQLNLAVCVLLLSCYYFTFFLPQKHFSMPQRSTSITSCRRPLRNHFPSSTYNKTIYHPGTKFKNSDYNYSNY